MTDEHSKAKQKEYGDRYAVKDPERRREQKRKAQAKYYKANKAKCRASTKKCDAIRKASDPELFLSKARKSCEKARRKKGQQPRKPAQPVQEQKARNRENIAKWVKENPDRMRELNRNWARKDRQENPEKYAERESRRVRDPEQRRQHNLLAKHRRRLKLENQPDIDIVAWKKTLELFDYKCLYCRADATSLDHVVPVDRGGNNHPSNCVPACKRCNSSKGKRDLLQWITGYRIAKEALSRPYDWKPEDLSPGGP
jgi:5-methylcytosine-specific restriction endonuclease McrA